MGEENLPGVSDAVGGLITLGIVVVIYAVIRYLQQRAR